MRRQALDKQVVALVYGRGRGNVFTPKQFTAIGDPRSVGMVLTRLCRKGTIRRLARGIYDYPRQHPQLGLLAPTPDAVARALAGRDAVRIQPSGAYAANQLGLSDQVPMRIVFLTDGSNRNVRIGKQEIRLKRTTPRNMATAGTVGGLVIQALRHLGRRQVDDSVIQQLRQRLSKEDRKGLQRQLQYAPAWIAAVLRQLAPGES